MDLIASLRNKIEALEVGDYVPGLKAVLLHIETAFRHLSRGQETSDDTAFTDAIYRTNQAFEGSIKEAYRVLAGQDPSRKRPFDIENYLENNSVFRIRVLDQFRTYRTGWRNPSAHDYNLDFDESEAFLAIVSVTAFACLLLNQIAERLSYLKSQAEAEVLKQTLSANLTASKNADILSRTIDILRQFCALHVHPSSSSAQYTEVQSIGALNGFFASVAPDLFVITEAILSPLSSDRHYRADLLISRGDEKVIVELKCRLFNKNIQSAIAQVERYMLISRIKNGIVLILPNTPSELEFREQEVAEIYGRLAVLFPKKSKFSFQQITSDNSGTQTLSIE